MAVYSVCPCCGAPRDARLAELDAEFFEVRYAGRSAKLGELDYRLVEMLQGCLPRPAYSDWLCETLGVNAPHLRNVVMRARRRLAGLGLGIERRDAAYRLAPARFAADAAAAPLARRAS